MVTISEFLPKTQGRLKYTDRDIQIGTCWSFFNTVHNSYTLHSKSDQSTPTLFWPIRTQNETQLHITLTSSLCWIFSVCRACSRSESVNHVTQHFHRSHILHTTATSNPQHRHKRGSTWSRTRFPLIQLVRANKTLCWIWKQWNRGTRLAGSACAAHKNKAENISPSHQKFRVHWLPETCRLKATYELLSGRAHAGLEAVASEPLAWQASNNNNKS